jgi:hypothetical protein
MVWPRRVAPPREVHGCDGTCHLCVSTWLPWRAARSNSSAMLAYKLPQASSYGASSWIALAVDVKVHRRIWPSRHVHDRCDQRIER